MQGGARPAGTRGRSAPARRARQPNQRCDGAAFSSTGAGGGLSARFCSCESSRCFAARALWDERALDFARTLASVFGRRLPFLSWNAPARAGIESRRARRAEPAKS